MDRLQIGTEELTQYMLLQAVRNPTTIEECSRLGIDMTPSFYVVTRTIADDIVTEFGGEGVMSLATAAVTTGFIIGVGMEQARRAQL
jgi:hypothetical protein